MVLALASCGDDGPTGGVDRPPQILRIDAPEPVLEGSRLYVTGLDLDTLGATPFMRLEVGNAEDALPVTSRPTEGQLTFHALASTAEVFGAGAQTVDAILMGNGIESEPYEVELSFASSLSVTLSTVPAGSAHRNDAAIVRGSGLLFEGEGAVSARFLGLFHADGGGTVPVDVQLGVVPLERTARDRGSVRLTTAIGGIGTGLFDGTITLTSRLVSGLTSTSTAVASTLQFMGPEIFTSDPDSASLERIIIVRGAGFLGGAEEPDEATLIRFSGMLAPEGLSASPFGPEELVFEFVSGSELRGVLRSRRIRDRLVSELFGIDEGFFEGVATPVVIKGTDELEGGPVPFQFTLEPIHQVVYLSFLPAFYDSLALFGLALSEGTIEPLIEERIESIYDGYQVDVRLERPTDYSRNGYATVEIGGPDPNGVGLFGYDNTPGKDVGNLRLFDAIGGSNAETQADGYPGYGGVFVETMIFFSARPGLGGGRPVGAPLADPLFDEIMDPVRTAAATPAELRGEGPVARVAEVDRALRALASMIGETSAHELGHSLGLAEPYGSTSVFHNPGDRDGCLMDSGGNRPLGERMAQPGFAATTLCYDAPAYMTDILGP